MPDKELLFSVTRKDFDIATFSGSGAGGQHRNRHPNCVRITHRASGATATGTEQRKMHQNQIVAFRRLVETPKFKAWLKLEICRAAGMFDDVDERVNQEMRPSNLRVEGQVGGKWTEI